MSPILTRTGGVTVWATSLERKRRASSEIPAVLGDAGKSGATYFFRPGKENGSDVVEDEKGSWPDFHIINPGNTTAMKATANMPPGMGAARLNTSNTSNLSSSFGESFLMQGSRLVGGFVMPTAGTGMRMLFWQNKQGQNYGCFFTDYYELGANKHQRYDWPANNGYSSRASEATEWSSNIPLLEDVWNHWRFGRDGDGLVRYTNHTWDGSSWSLRNSLSHSGGSTIAANASDSWCAFYGEASTSGSYGSTTRGLIGYWGNTYWADFNGTQTEWESDPPSS
jgi:hypothetical protein